MKGTGQKTIAEMSHADLAKFVHNILQTQTPDKAAAYEQMDVHGTLNVKDKINLSPQAKKSLLDGTPVLLLLDAPQVEADGSMTWKPDFSSGSYQRLLAYGGAITISVPTNPPGSGQSGVLFLEITAP